MSVLCYYQSGKCIDMNGHYLKIFIALTKCFVFLGNKIIDVFMQIYAHNQERRKKKGRNSFFYQLYTFKTETDYVGRTLIEYGEMIWKTETFFSELFPINVKSALFEIGS